MERSHFNCMQENFYVLSNVEYSEIYIKYKIYVCSIFCNDFTTPYCVEMWGNNPKTNLMALCLLQRNAILVCESNFFDHIIIFRNLYALPLFDLIKFRTAIFM